MVLDRNCAALRGLNHLGAEGYHWRVCVEDKPVPGETSDGPTFSWWDIQDENAKLPIKQASQYRLSKLFAQKPSEETATNAARGAFKSLGKAMSQAVTGESGGEEGPPVPVVAFKLLDLVKLHDEFSAKHPNGRGPGHKASQPRVRAPSSATPSQPPRASAPQPSSRPAARVAPPRQQEASLMDFGPPSSAPSARRPLHHSQSTPASINQTNETRAERLKREYAEKNQKANRVWDEVDQRWVEIDPNSTSVHTSSSEPPRSNNMPQKKEIGISLDPANAIGKSASVQAAVHQRVNEMRESQQKALQEIRDREQKKKAAEAEEDAVRKKLEPIIKAWSEEHGKKKQLRALLASLHTILWPGADWKPISIGDVLDDSKMKKFFHKASRVVHPDKTHHLDAEKRFLAKRIFDALSQAKADFDNGSR